MTAEPTTPSGVPDVPFQGRRHELARLADHLDRLDAGQGGTVRIVGGPGSGKSRLIKEALEGRGLAVASGAASEAEQGRPLAALANALDEHDAYRPSPGSAASTDAIWIAVDRLVGVAEARATRTPLVLVLDDLQWSDKGSWLAAAALARRAPSAGFLLITSHRPLPARQAPPVTLSALGESIELERLSPTESRALGESVLGSSPMGTSADLIERAYRTAAEAHFGQFRKSGEPYIAHPIAVARIVAELGLDETTIAAALLHDAVEDTGLTAQDLVADTRGRACLFRLRIAGRARSLLCATLGAWHPHPSIPSSSSPSPTSIRSCMRRARFSPRGPA